MCGNARKHWTWKSYEGETVAERFPQPLKNPPAELEMLLFGVAAGVFASCDAWRLLVSTVTARGLHGGGID